MFGEIPVFWSRYYSDIYFLPQRGYHESPKLYFTCYRLLKNIYIYFFNICIFFSVKNVIFIQDRAGYHCHKDVKKKKWFVGLWYWDYDFDHHNLLLKSSQHIRKKKKKRYVNKKNWNVVFFLLQLVSILSDSRLCARRNYLFFFFWVIIFF